jgi:hypothetical protein
MKGPCFTHFEIKMKLKQCVTSAGHGVIFSAAHGALSATVAAFVCSTSNSICFGKSQYSSYCCLQGPSDDERTQAGSVEL